MELFYTSPQNINELIVSLDVFESRHIVQTLRKKIGEIINISNGKGTHYEAEIIALKPYVQARILKKQHTAPLSKKIILATGFIRPNRLEFILEKGTELGIASFWLFKSEHTNYFSNNVKRFEKITRQAMKQSLRFYLPTIKLFSGFNAFLQTARELPVKIVATTPDATPLKEIGWENRAQEILLTIGPEGGFSEDEIRQLQENKFHTASLGETRLRTETACLAGCAYLLLA